MNPALRHSAAHVFVGSVAAPQPDAADLHHLTRVLRLRDGEAVTVGDGAGAWRVTELRHGVLVPVGEVVHEPLPAPCTIAAAIPKGDRVEWMVQKLTELGVAEIVLVDSARSATRWDADRTAKQLARLGRIAREAAAQSRRAWLPDLRGPVPFEQLVAERAAAHHPVALLEPDAAEPLGPTGPRTVLVGPEGGFAPAELAEVEAHRRLVDTVLRVETAAVAAAAVLLTPR